jgi:diacylglycerol kinase (ATP)
MTEVLRLDKIKRYLFVINPIAGKRSKDEFYELIEDYSSLYKWEYQLYKTTGERDVENIRNKIESFRPQAVIAVGGDGTVSMVAEMLAGTDLILGIVPAGSGNGFSKDIDIPQNNQQAAFDSLLHGKVEKIDTLKANQHFFMHLADVGFNAHIVKLYDNSSSRGLKTYAKFVLQEFFKYPSHHYEVETDGGNFRGKAFMITIANSRQFGSNLTINPDGNWADGKFEIVIIRRFPRSQVLRFFWRLLTKKIKFSPYSIILQCTRAKIRCRSERTLQYDGEVAGKVKEVSIGVAPQNLHIIVP